MRAGEGVGGAGEFVEDDLHLLKVELFARLDGRAAGRRGEGVLAELGSAGRMEVVEVREDFADDVFGLGNGDVGRNFRQAVVARARCAKRSAFCSISAASPASNVSI